MTRIVTFRTEWMTVTSNIEGPSDSGFIPATDFVCPAGALDAARMRYEIRNITGTIGLTPCLNVANLAQAPTSTAVQLGGTWSTTVGLKEPGDVTDVTASSYAAQIARFGFASRNTAGTGTGLSTAQVRAVIEAEIAASYRRMWAPPLTVYASSTTPVFFPATRWVPGLGALRGRCAFEMNSRTHPDLVVAPGFQVANDPSAPDSGAAMGSYLDQQDAMQFPTQYTTITNAAARELVRFGWMVKLQSAGSIQFAAVNGAFEYRI